MSNGLHFTPQTFAYFDEARAHAEDRAWFEGQRALYIEHVEVPFHHLASQLKTALGPALPGVSFSPRKLSRPLLRQGKGSEGGAVRDKAYAFFSEPPSSLFESNPGVYVSIGAGPEDNVVGCGLYMPSARQLRELRSHFGPEAAVLKGILEQEDLRSHWGGLAGDRYKRFPQGYGQGGPGEAFFWHKQFFVSKRFTRKQVCSRSFGARVVEACVAALPLLVWTRTTVGVYQKQEPRS